MGNAIALFEQRIVARVNLCKIGNLYFEMTNHLLSAPLTLRRLDCAIHAAIEYKDRLTANQLASIFKHLLSEWIEYKMNERKAKQKSDIEIGTEWIAKLRPVGYKQIKMRKDEKKQEDIPIIAGYEDIPIGILRPVLVQFAAEIAAA